MHSIGWHLKCALYGDCSKTERQYSAPSDVLLLGAVYKSLCYYCYYHYYTEQHPRTVSVEAEKSATPFRRA